MANLELKKWERYVPAIGNNRELPEGQRLELEIRTHLTRDELIDWTKRLQTAFGGAPEEAVKVLDENIRLVGKHTIGGHPIENFGQYFALTTTLMDSSHWRELLEVVTKFNTFSEDDAVFSERLSGGTVSTLRRSAAKKDEKTEGR